MIKQKRNFSDRKPPVAEHSVGQVRCQPITYTVDSENSGRRMDNFLFSQLKDVPKSVIYRLIRQKEVKVNKKRVDLDSRLQEGDKVVIYSLKLSARRKSAALVPSSGAENKLLQAILYEDDNVIVLNKPVGMAVHGGTDVSLGVIEILRHAREDLPFIELVHRLDRETSGCLVIAKKRSVLRELHQGLRDGSFDKTYFALTLGHWPKPHNRVTVSLRKNVKTSGERKVKVDETGKESITDFEVRQVFSQATFVAVRLYTGRTHQIRVHAEYAGHPIAGDEKYGDRAFNRIMKQQGLKRLFLHAGKIKFKIPSKDKTIDVEAPLDEELGGFLTTLT